MRFFGVAVFLLVVALGTQAGFSLYTSVSSRAQTAASFLNDSNIVNIPDDEVEEIVIEASDEGVNTSNASSGGGSGDVVFGTDTTNTDSDTIVDVAVSLDSSSDSEGGADNNGGGDSSQNSQTVSSQSILDTLKGSQAVSSSSGGSSGGGGINISGQRTREALLGRGIQSITVPPIPKADSSEAKVRAPYTRNDLTIIVSAALVTNPDIDDVFFTTDALTVSYKSRGRLLLALPIAYSTKLSLSFDETTVKKRVKVKFPWYKFLMYTGVSKKALRNTVDQIITTTPAGQEYDRATHIFKAVSDLIVSQRTTVQGTLNTVQ